MMATTNSLNSPERSSAVAHAGNDEAVPVQIEPAVAEVDTDMEVKADGNDEKIFDTDSEDDRKPAAIEKNDGDTEDEDDAAADSEVDDDDDDDDDDGENDDSEGNASSDDNNDKDDDQDDQEENSSDDGGNNGRAGAAGASPDDRQLSEYELLRLERIKRNKQYLSALGLEGTSANGGVKASGKPVKRKRKKVSPSQKRSSLSRRTKESVSYTEPPAGVAGLIRTVNMKEEEKMKDRPPKPPSERKTKDPVDRLEKFVFLEFKSIKAHKRQVLSQAEKNLAKASKEVKFWKKRAEVFERRQQRKLDRKVEQAKIIKRLEDERRQLGGGTAKELLQDIDNRMPDILSAVARYDAKLEAAANIRDLEVKHLENEMKMKMLDSLDRFPKAVKDAVSVLNTELLSRAPKDPPPPRRSKRGDGDEVVENATTKNGSKREDGNRNSSDDTGDTLRELQAGLVVSEDDVHSPAKGQSTKGRKRNARNVGGWVSPNFSTEIDRRWLQRDKADDEFDISAYVPQVGDTVLYYPGGHREFLDKYPDLLGKKTRSTTRIPLWERATMERSQIESEPEGGEIEATEPLPKSWWNDEWLAGIENDLGKYPIVCRVERTQAEFPPDPYTKVVKKVQGSEDVRIYWKSPKNTADHRNDRKPPLRLAVALRPLTPLLPPVWDEAGPSSDDYLSLPPLFNVVIFPSDLQPFLIPFAWAYSASHSLSLDETVSLGSLKGAAKARIASFASLDDKFGSFRLDDKESFIEKILMHFNSKQESQRSVLEREFAAASRTFPLPEAFLVLKTLTNFINCRDEQINGNKSPQVKAVHLLDFIRSTLPLWESVSIMKNVYNRKKSQMSPWTLKAGKSQSKTFAEVSHTLDEALRVKIECVIEDYAQEHELAEMFYSSITEEDAPGYDCAVACSVSLEKVLRRLNKSETKSHRCYYRGVEGVLSDINAILDNCLLYNSPESTVVENALDVVTALKKEISHVAQSHFSEMKEVMTADENRRRLVMHNGQSASSGSPAFIIDTVSNPYKEPGLHRDWLQTTHAEMRTGEVSSQTGWVPQPGDEVIYSHRLHTAFVKGHYRSLESEQCLIPPPPVTSTSAAGEQQDADNGSDGTEDWSKGKVFWTRASFPKVPSKKSGEDADTFPTNSSLLALGILFQHDDQDKECVHVLYWRPCVFSFDLVFDDANSCLCCGVCRRTSFLQPASVLPPDESVEHISHGLTRSFAEDERGRIDRCFALLKKRCLRDVSPGYVDPQLTKQNVKQGYLPPLVKVGAKSMVSFEDAFEKQSHLTRGADVVVTRGITTKPLPENSLVGPLVKAGFLPPWIAFESGKVDIALHERYGTILPCPNLSLELIHLRLKNQYYRHKAAVENDIIESYVCAVYMLLAEVASRKKNPVSIKRIARSLATGKGKPNTEKSTDKEPVGGVNNSNGKSSEDRRSTAVNSTLTNHVMEEEAKLLTRLYRIRELYAVAIVSLSETTHTERIFGLNVRPSVAPLEQVVPLASPQDLVRAEARQKLKHILSAIGKDRHNNSLCPPVKVKIVCNGRVVEYDKYSVNLTRATAVKDGSEIHVRIICDGQPITVERTLPPTSRAVTEGEGNQENVFCVKANSITFGRDDYEANDPLGRVFFGRPGRMSPCGRCQAYKRSMVSCRVRRGHSNIDFDWPTFFEGLEGMDGLLRALEGDTILDKPDTTPEDGTDNFITTSEVGVSSAGNNGRSDQSDTNDAGAEKSGRTEGRLQNHTNGTTRDTVSLGKSCELMSDRNETEATELVDKAESVVLSSNTLSEHGSTAMRNEGSQNHSTLDDLGIEKTSNPRELVEKARITLAFAKDVVEKARAHAATPARLSAEFVSSSFPVDPGDGHYIYCIVCGLSGDLLCCDGCANVVHSHCISLKSIPDDDWFCEECVGKKPTGGRAPREGTESSVATETETGCLPFGRVVRFDNNPSDEVSLTLRALRSARPEITIKQKVAGDSKSCGGEDDDESHASGSDGDADDDDDIATPRKRGRPRKRPKIDGDDDIATPRKRGRPPKRPKMDSAVSPTKGKEKSTKGAKSRQKANVKAALDSRPISPRRTANPRSFKDPIDGLSNVTKRFLTSMKITTAEKFLSSRTTDIAVKFIAWRLKQEMTELKGIGAIASVSAWKTQARKFAKEMGLEDIADIEPASKPSRWEEAREKARKVAVNSRTKGRGSPRKKPSGAEMDSAVSATARTETSTKDATPRRGRQRKKHTEEEFELQSLTAESGRRRGAWRSPETPKLAIRATRGRPRKHPDEEQLSTEALPESPSRRGRPRKIPAKLGPTTGRETVEPVPSRKRGRQREEPSEGDNTRSQRRSQPPKRFIDSVVYDVETPPGRVRHQRQARGIDFGTIKQEQPQILRNSLQAKKSPAEKSEIAAYSVTSETSIPQRRQRRATKRLVDESVEPRIPTEIIKSSEQNVDVGDSADLLSIDDARDDPPVEEQPSETRRSKRRRL